MKTSTKTSTTPSALLGFIAGAVALSAFAVYLAVLCMPVSPALTHDSASYLSASQNLVHTGRFVYSTLDTLSHKAFEETSAYMPGYQVIVAGLLSAGLGSETALYAVTVFGLLALTLLTFAAAWRITGSLIAAALAGVWALTMPQILDVMTFALTESLYIPCTMAAMLLTVLYTQQPREKFAARSTITLALLAFCLSWAPMIRAFGLGLIGAVCGSLLLRTLLEQGKDALRGRRLWMEVLVGIVAITPLALNLLTSYWLNGCAYCGTTPNRVDLGSVAVTREWIARLMVSDFIPSLNLGFGLRQFVRDPISLAVLGFVGVVVAGVMLLTLWRNRTGLGSAITGTVGWARLPIWLYIVAYLVFIFGTSTPGVYVNFNYPRYLVPLYPFFILLVIAFINDLFQRVPALPLRAALVAGVALYGLGIAQSANAFVSRASNGRGIEVAETRNHPAWAYLRQALRSSDVVFSTKAPTVWYYVGQLARQPMRRLDGVDKLRCTQLAMPAPGSNGRSVFVLFPFYVFKGNPAEPANIVWFRAWASECGTVTDVQTFQDAAVFVVEPMP